MAKAKVDNARQKVLEQENIILRKKLADQEKRNQELAKLSTDHITTEMKKIRQKGRSSANKIEVVSAHDHKNISLWTRGGKRVGPMHPDNAIQTLNRFADIGVALSADQPTLEQIEAYKETAEWKKKEATEKVRRERKDKSKRTGQMDRLSKEIAKMSNTTVESINKIIKASEVGKR